MNKSILEKVNYTTLHLFKNDMVNIYINVWNYEKQKRKNVFTLKFENLNYSIRY